MNLMWQSIKHTNAEHLYALLLRLYPSEHRQAYGLLMRQAFRDSYREALDANGKVGLGFWLEVVDDEVRSIAREQGAALQGQLRQIRAEKLDLASSLALLGGGLVFVVKCIH
jgi:hypothetical protein